MERAGIDIRYDPRTLKEQGIDRDPEIHIGPKAQALDEKGYDFESQDHVRGERSIPYTLSITKAAPLTTLNPRPTNSQNERRR